MSFFKRALLALASIPMGLLLGILLTFCDLLARASSMVGGRRRQPADTGTPQSSGVSIIVLNWNGRRLLEESLPALEKALRQTSIRHEVIVVDNGSSDESVLFVRQRFPNYRVLALHRNLGFGEGNNAGIRAASHDLVLLLNNDMIVEEAFLEPLVQAISAETFAATSQLFLPSGLRREETGKTVARLRHSRLELSHEEITLSDETNRIIRVFWAGGGSTLYRKRLFLQLGGFDRLYSPSYAEDADLSFRAWQAGYPSVIAVASRILHKHKSSTRRRFGESGAHKLMQGHIRLFFLKNFSIKTLWKYFLWLPANSWANSELVLLLRTFPRWPLLMARRIRRRRPVFSEHDIFHRLGTPVIVDRRSAIGIADSAPFDQTSLTQQQGAATGSTQALNAPSEVRIPKSKRPLRILYVSAYVPHLWKHGGAGRVFQLIRRVAQQHEVSVATFYENDAELQQCDTLHAFCKSVTPIYRYGAVPTNVFPYEPFAEFDLPEMRQALQQLARQCAFDIVHFEYTQMACYADLFPDAVKFLTEVEVNYAATASRISYLSNPLRRLKCYYNAMQVLDRELALCRKVDHVICVNETDARLLRAYLPERPIHVVHTGVDINYFNLSRNCAEDPSSVGFVGAFRHEPNVDAALYFLQRIFPLVKQLLPQSRCYLIGSSPPEEIQRWHNGKDVFVTGFVEDLLHYYHRMTVIAVPLRTGVGIRGKILEAWAAGRPVVGTSLAAAGIMATQGQNMYIADQPEEFALWTTRLLENLDTRYYLGYYGRQTAEHFYDWNLLAPRLCALYEQV